jgi:protease-4
VISIAGAIADKGSRLTRAADRGTITATLRQAAGDANVRAVVLHINSPGGSAFASELIHHEVERLARSKPVIAYVGDIAASGGYYVAAPCQRIVARPLSITGSIGVVSAKPAISDMLEHIGISPQTLRTAPHADMFSNVRPQSASEKQVWQEHTQELYTRFLDIVATGRKRPVADIEAIAGGRVWSGQEASDNGLVDALGGMERAFELARDAIKGLSPAERAELSLRPIRAKSAGEAPPPAADPLPTPARLLSELDPDLAFLLSAEREPGAYYACGLSQLLDVDAAPPSLDTVMLLSFVQSCGAGAVSAALAQALPLPAPTPET